MMHWTNEPELLAILKRGDILTHPFNIPTPNQSNLFGGAPGKVLPQILELKDRGIWTESQAVNSHHLWVNSEAAFAQGWAPDLISTDMGAITPQTPNGLMLPWTMTQYLHLGLTIEQIIERVTLTPTKVFKFPEKHGTLETGRDRRRHRHRSAGRELRADRSAEQQAHCEAEDRAGRHGAWRYADEDRSEGARDCAARRPEDLVGVLRRIDGADRDARTTMHRYLIVVVVSAAGLATALAQAPTTVLDGVYTHEQAERGEAVYSSFLHRVP